MKLKELIEKYEEYENGLFDFGAKIACQNFLKDLQQLDEPEKVKVKQFVADWYEENKDDFELNLWLFLTEFDEENIDRSERFGIWLGDEANNPIQTLVNMHQFGYEVEKEKQYAVKIKASGQYLAKTKLKEISFMYNGACSHFTRKELEEAGFGWVFDCPGIEIEEVEG